MSNLTDYFHHTHQCPCGSGLVFSWYKNAKQEDQKACEKCKQGLLYKIFDNRFLDIFEEWLPRAMFDEVAPLGYEFQWEDLVKEKGCIRSKETHVSEHIAIKCPENDEFYVHIPKEYAEQVLKSGIMI